MSAYSAGRGMGWGGAVLGFVGGMVVWALFGEKIKKKVNESKAYQEMKSQVLDRTNAFRDMTQTRYNQIVDEVSSAYGKAKGISQNELQDMVSDLKFHWARIKDRWKDPPSSNIATGAGSTGSLSDSEPKLDDSFDFRA